jgi:hypothetical protein
MAKKKEQEQEQGTENESGSDGEGKEEDIDPTTAVDESGKPLFNDEQQKFLDKLMGSRADRAREQGRQEAADKAAKDKEAADRKRKAEAEKKEQERLEAEGKLQEAHDGLKASSAKLETELETLKADHETVSADLKRHEKALEKLLEARRKGLPGHVTALLDKMDAVAQLEYIAEFGEDLTKEADGKPGSPGRGRQRRGTGGHRVPVESNRGQERQPPRKRLAKL